MTAVNYWQDAIALLHVIYRMEVFNEICFVS